jgi:hypothetical protein
MTGFKDFRFARIILAGIEAMHMIRKCQMQDNGVKCGVADQFYSLATYGILILWRRPGPILLNRDTTIERVGWGWFFRLVEPASASHPRKY